MTSDLFSRLSVVKADADKSAQDRENYKAYVADRVEHGGWSSEDVAEYREQVGRIMASGSDDEKAAASEFWASKRVAPAGVGANERIRARIERDKQEAA